MSDDQNPIEQKNPIDPIKALEFMRDHAPILAKAKAERVYMDEYRKSLKAILMRKSGEKTAVDREADAYAHPDYLAHLEGLKAAVEAEEAQRWLMVAAQAKVETWRSLESSLRALVSGAR